MPVDILSIIGGECMNLIKIKDENIFSVLVHPEKKVTNKAKYTTLQVCCAAVHFILIFTFAAANVLPMVIFNCFSTVCYILCGILIKKEKYIPLYYITYVEICLHSYVAAILVGWDTGFPMYIIGIMPVIIYMHFSFNENSSLKETLLIGICALTVFLSCKFITYFNEPLYELSPINAFWIYIFNSLCTFGLILLFSVIFLSEIKSAHAVLKKQNARLDRIAGTDVLTGLYNRRSMDKFLKNAAASKVTYSLIMCDIDDFKKINDTYGHKCGDMVLKEISKIIVSGLRDNDFVCRWGGEEILILVNDTTLKSAAMAAERIRSSIEKLSLESNGHTVRCTITLGAAESSEGSSPEDVISIADSRLYTGKRTGKNRVVIS